MTMLGLAKIVERAACVKYSLLLMKDCEGELCCAFEIIANGHKKERSTEVLVAFKLVAYSSK